MIGGYALATSWLYGVGAGIASLPGNIIQSLFGVIVALPLSQTLKRVLPKWSFRRKKDEQMTIDEKC